MNKTRRIFDIIWVAFMLFCCSLDFYKMLTDFNIWLLIGFILCGISAILKGVQMYHEDMERERLKELRNMLSIDEHEFQRFMKFFNHKKDKDNDDKGD